MTPPVQPPTDEKAAISAWIDRTFCPVCEERRGTGSCRHVESVLFPPQPPTDRTESTPDE